MRFPDDFTRHEYNYTVEEINSEIKDMIKSMERDGGVEIESGGIRIEKASYGIVVTVAPVKYVYNPKP